ncbi:MAG: LysR family transcriptional regulator [Verrucomicrobia bacterium]|nr:LysR family transcriptional regulator [Verrucomicrobiota bacterium]
MQIETFKVFCDLVETASFSRAATLNSITQSAVSQQIRALELRYGVSLIERGKKNFCVTSEGRAFLQASREILATYENLGSRLRELQNIVAGELTIATVFSIGLHELPPFLKKFSALYPDVELKLEYRRSSQVYNEVLEGKADVGLVAFPTKRKGIIVENFWKDKLVLICHPGHELAERRRVTLRDLQGEKFISFEPDLPTRKAIDRMLRHHGVEIAQVMELDNVEAVKRAVAIENGISIVPQTTVANEVRHRSLVAVEVESFDMWRPLGALYRRHRSISPAQRQFVGMLRETRWLEDPGFRSGKEAA